MRQYLIWPLLVTILVVGLALGTGGMAFARNQVAATLAHNFHSAPPAEPLPPVLDASPFLENRSAFVAYRLASRIPETLYQIPCYCGCDRNRGHESLLDCFTGNHGTHCRICQKEAVFCFVQRKKRRSASEIREAIARGELAKLDLEKYAHRFYAQLRKSQQ